MLKKMKRRKKQGALEAPRRGAFVGIGLLVAVIVTVIGLWLIVHMSADRAAGAKDLAVFPTTQGVAKYVGRSVCATCHAKEERLWHESHHDLAMQEASDSTVLGDFDDTTFTYNNITSHFYRRDNQYFVNTDGPDGKLIDYPIEYTFGVWPLQQYLVAFPGGRLQALPLAWDARPKEKGGQRWFYLYPNEQIDHKDQLHWTGLYQNWNLQCASCHSTNLKKGFDASTNTYKTTFSELDVSCEACHGPGSRHVSWASRAKNPEQHTYDNKGLSVVLRSRWDEAWMFSEHDTAFPRRDRPADKALMNVCAPCHSRRSTLTEDRKPGEPLAESHRLAMITPPLYHADGQIRDEVYVWGSFLQSRMFQKGVTCMDCHEPHTTKLRVEGNALCTRCHNAAKFDSQEHHFHKSDTNSAQCVECHMPAQNYMVIDARRDHSIRLPRPDLSQSLGSPNACTQCHIKQNAEWAAASLDKWYGTGWRDRRHFGTTLHAGETQGARAVPALLELAHETMNPALVRATAVTLLQPYMQQSYLDAARSLLRDSDPDVRIAALGLIEAADPVARLREAAALLEDPVRGVRVEAARILADLPTSQIPEARRQARATALNEYLAALQLNADWPAENVSLGNLYLRQNRVDKAIAAYDRALTLDPQFIGAYVNLADAYRIQRQEDEAERVLRRGLGLLPNAADLRHALGLLLVRKGDRAAAITELERAAQFAPENVRYTYVYAVALHSIGKRREAIRILQNADSRHPGSPDILNLLVSINRDAGNRSAALHYAKKLAAAMPNDPSVKQILRELQKNN